MKFTIISIGKIKNPCIYDLVEDYTKRISKFIPIHSIEIKDLKGFSHKDRKVVIEKESKLLLKYLKSENINLCLDECGKNNSTKEFASFLTTILNSGKKEVAFFIGGPFGISEEIKKKSKLISLSKMTFPHELAKAILLEQIYRAMTVIKGIKYHY